MIKKCTREAKPGETWLRELGSFNFVCMMHGIDHDILAWFSAAWMLQSDPNIEHECATIKKIRQACALRA